MKFRLRFMGIGVVSFTLAAGLSALAHADMADPEYASNSCLRDKRPSKVCCEEVLDGDKKEIAECVKLVASKRKNAADTKAAKAAKKADAPAVDKPSDEVKKPGEKSTGPKPSSNKGLRGSWTTEFGDTMVIEQETPQFRARFNFKDGRIVGEFKGNTMNGFWIQSSSKTRCSEERDGSFHWGRMQLVFAGNSYNGGWSYCDTEINQQLKQGNRK